MIRKLLVLVILFCAIWYNGISQINDALFKIDNLNLLENQITIRNWRLIGPFLDSVDILHDFNKMGLNQGLDSLDYLKFKKFTPYKGDKHQGEFLRFQGRGDDAVNANLDKNDLYNFGDTISFTIELKIKATLSENNKFPSILAKRLSLKTGEPGWCIFFAKKHWLINFGQKGKKNIQVAGENINDGYWHSISVVCLHKKEGRLIKTFTDGKLNNSIILPNDFGDINSTAPLTIGYLAGSNAAATFFISDVRIWKTAIKDDIIKSHKWDMIINKSNPFYKYLLGYWKCRDGAGNILKNEQKEGGDFKIYGDYEWEMLNEPIYNVSLANTTYKKDFIYNQQGDYIDFNKVYKISSGASCFASVIINSTIDQDIVLLMGIEDAAKIWINGKLCFKEAINETIAKNRVAISVHLVKGNNEIVCKIFNKDRYWRFNLDISSIRYVRDNAIGNNYFSFSNKYLLKKGDSLEIVIRNPSFITTKHTFNASIYNTNNEMLISKNILNSKKIALDKLLEGVYNCRIITDLDTIDQKFTYGNYNEILNQLINKAKNIEDSIKLNIEILFKRANYLKNYGLRNGYDENLERKLAWTLFEIEDICKNISKHEEAFAHISGLHIRGFISSIDNSEDNYMIFVPPNYKKEKKIPLVVMMPFVTKLTPFISGYHVSDIERIEFLSTLACKYEFAILWPSSRIYAEYNLNRITPIATFEAIGEVKKKYNIDNQKIYLYGDCSGGLQALLMANRFPSLFAAVGVEGPELGYTECDDCYSTQWLMNNNIYNTIENFSNIPIYILHSMNDFKAKYYLSKELISEVRKKGGNVKYDDLNNAEKSVGKGDANPRKMIPENIIMNKVFSFFNNKSLRTPDTVNFATYQAKYNQAYWITLTSINQPNLATIRAIVLSNNTIEIETSNVFSFSIKIKDLQKISKKEKLKVIVNGVSKYNEICKEDELSIILNLNQSKLTKSTQIEGPINDIFTNSFIIVKNSQGTPEEINIFNNAADTLIKDWKVNYFSKCVSKKDVEVSDLDIRNSNLILIGTPQSNLLIKKIIKDLPIIISKQYIEIKEKKYEGSKLSYSIIYPNPLNPNKYILIIGSNFDGFLSEQLKMLSYRGYSDYEIWDVEKGYQITQGDFDFKWQ